MTRLRPSPPALRSLAALLLAGLATLATAGPAAAALQPSPATDVEWLLEHLPEAAMDARFATLPLAAAPLAPGRWQTVAGLAWSSDRGEIARLEGTLVSAAVVRGLSERWGIEALVAFDRLSFGGDGGNDALHPLFRRDIPLDLPENADFSDPRGTYRSTAFGLAAVHQWPGKQRPERRWTLTAGALAQRVELTDFAVDYTLTGGRDAGAAGILDHSATYDFVSPFVAIERELPLTPRFTLRPRVVAAFPVPRQGITGRITGPGFDLAGDTASAGHGKHMGDPSLGLGVEVEHVASGLALDLGASLTQPLIERAAHAGLDRSWLVSLTWRPARRRPTPR